MSQAPTTLAPITNKGMKINFGIFLLIILAGIYYWYLTNNGLVLNPDSVVYLGVANNLSIGEGLHVPFGLPPQVPLAQFPPLLAWILYGITKLGLSLELSARLLNLTLLFLLIFLVDKLQRIISKKYPLLRLSLLFYVIIFLLTTFLFTTLAAEPLMIVLGLSGVLLFIASEDKNSIFLLLLSGIMLACSVMARYAGVTYLAASALVLLLSSQVSWLKRFVKIIVLSLPTLLFLPLWLLRSNSVDSSSTNRIFLIHPIRLQQISAALTTISNWFLVPVNSPVLLKLMVVLVFSLLIVTVFILSFRKNNEKGSNLLPKTISAFFLVYPLFLIFSITFLDANIPLDKRLLSPLFVLIALILPFLMQSFSRKIPLTNFLVFGVSFLFLCFSSLLLFQNRIFIQQVHQFGFGFNYTEFKNDPLFPYLSHIDQPAIFISNAAEPVYLFTQHEVFLLPKRFNAMENRDNPHFDTDITSLKEKYLKEPTYFIFFDKITGGSIDDQNFYKSEFGLNFIEKFKNAAVYSYLPNSTP